MTKIFVVVSIDWVLAIMGSAVMGAIVTHILNRKKTQTEIESLVVKQALDMVQTMRIEIDRLEKRMDNYAQREMRLMQEVDDLKKEYKQLRLEVDKLSNNK